MIPVAAEAQSALLAQGGDTGVLDNGFTFDNLYGGTVGAVPTPITPLHAPDKLLILCFAALFGVGSALALIGIGLNPYDTDAGGHETALFSWVALLLVTVILHFWALLTSKECVDVFSIASFGFAMVIGFYIVGGLDILSALWQGAAAPSEGHAIVMQKIVVLCAVSWYLLFGLRMVFTTKLRPSERNEKLNRLAEKYMKTLRN